VGLDCGIVPLSSNLRPFHDELDEVERISLFSLLFSVPVDPVRCGLSPLLVWSCCFLDFIPSIPIMAMASGSKGGESRVFSVVGFSMLEPLYAYTFWAKTFPWFSR
jgi:predicted AlkP superfamily pyrophosphatase or phosphodiesterase